MYNVWTGMDCYLCDWAIIGDFKTVKTTGFFRKKYAVIDKYGRVEVFDEFPDLYLTGYRLTIERNMFVGDFYYVMYDYSLRMYTVKKEGKTHYAFESFRDAINKAKELL